MKFAFAVFAALAAGGAVAGDRVTYGYGGEMQLASAQLRMVPLVLDSDWGQVVGSGWSDKAAEGTAHFAINRKGWLMADGDAKFALEGGKVKAEWDFDVKVWYECNGIVLSARLPVDAYAGGAFVGDGRETPLPKDVPANHLLATGSFKSAEFRTAAGETWRIESESPVFMMLQDNRKWNEQTFTLRIPVGASKLVKDEKRRVAFTLSTGKGIDALASSITRVERGADWIPVDDTTAIAPGSAIDFSKQPWFDAPAGKYGRVRSVNGHFEFEGRPGVPQRFYGVNLCFDANYMTEQEAEECVSRLVRIGYNSVRIHHYERALCKGSEDGTRINPEQMAKLDNLLNACIRRGVYLTTDAFVSRAPTWKSLGEDKPGSPNISEYKDMCLFNDRAYASLCDFTRQLLNHVNPKTGRRWAEEPALGWIAFINEGNPGNYGLGIYRRPEALAKWKAWLADKKAKDPRFKDVTEDFNNNIWLDGDRQNCAFTMFLADLGADFDARFGRFIREELGCKALFTNMSCWYNPLVYQLNRTKYDYVDDHFYVDHPEFLEFDWSLPSKCGNANPVRTPSVGFQHVVNHRLLDKPFTITEYNFCAPSAWRGVGGIMLGAEAALQDYDGVWRFDWATGVEFDWKPIGYFDVARDPLTRATERAALCLYMRRDMRPLAKTFAMTVDPEWARGELAKGPRFDLKEPLWFGWYAKLGTSVGTAKPAGCDWAGGYPGVAGLKDDYFRGLVAANGLKPGDGQMVLDREHGVFGMVTPRTCGFSAEGGSAAAGPLSAVIDGAPATVWASALDDRPLATSARILLSHVTDVQDHGTVFADESRSVLLKWGWMPHLMARGRAEIALKLDGEAVPKVYALRPDGSRGDLVPAKFEGGELRFTADIARKFASATFMYEIVR